jgi:hypothetical protein
LEAVAIGVGCALVADTVGGTDPVGVGGVQIAGIVGSLKGSVVVEVLLRIGEGIAVVIGVFAVLEAVAIGVGRALGAHAVFGTDPVGVGGVQIAGIVGSLKEFRCC